MSGTVLEYPENVGMSFLPNENQEMIADMIRKFGKEHIYPKYMEWDESQEFPVQVFKKSISPSLDHSRTLPPPTVRMRDWLTRMLSRENPRMLPWATVNMPRTSLPVFTSAAGVLLRPTIKPPPGTMNSILPPRSVLIRLAKRLISP